MAAKIIPFPLERRRAQIARENPTVEFLNQPGFVGVRLRAAVLASPGNWFWLGSASQRRGDGRRPPEYHSQRSTTRRGVR